MSTNWAEKAEWKHHFDYLLDYFRDERYIKVDGKPLFEIFNYSDDIYKMHQYWDELAKENGFNGIYIVYKKSALYRLPEESTNFCYEPQNSGWGAGWKLWSFKALSLLGLAGKNGPLKYSYDKVWQTIIKMLILGKNQMSGTVHLFVTMTLHVEANKDEL